MSDEPELGQASAEEIDLTAVRLDYEGFRRLAANPNLSPQQKIGAPDSYRDGFDEAILRDIARKLGGLDIRGARLADIGCGCGSLSQAIADCCADRGVALTLVDSAEMLANVPDDAGVIKIAGRFPDNLANVREIAPGGFDYVLCYSVLHHVFLDGNPFLFLDGVIDLLKPGGLALIGDIPNESKRKRFFSSAEGIAFHKAFMNTTEAPVVEFLKLRHGKLDDGVLTGLVQRAQNSGCDAYVLPQDPALPMANRRDDLLIRKY